MWGQLAGRIKENAGEILNVVAPTGSDEDYYTDDGEEEYEEYTDEEEEEEEQGEKTGFGALLGRFVDKEEEQYEDESETVDTSPVETAATSIATQEEEPPSSLRVESSQVSIEQPPRRKPPPPPPRRTLPPPPPPKLSAEESDFEQVSLHDDETQDEFVSNRLREEASATRKEQEQLQKEEMVKREQERIAKMAEKEERERQKQAESARQQREAEIARQEAEKREREEEQRLLKERKEEELQRQRELEIIRKQQEETRRRELEIARRQEEEKQRQEAELTRQQEEQERRAKELARQREKAEIAKKREAEVARQREEEVKRQQEAEMVRKREAEVARQREEEAKRLKEAEMIRKREAEAAKQREEEAKRQQEAEIERKKKEAEITRKQEEERKKRIAENRRIEEEEQAKREKEVMQQKQREMEAAGKREQERLQAEETRTNEAPAVSAVNGSLPSDVAAVAMQNELVRSLREQVETMKLEKESMSQLQGKNKDLDHQLHEVRQQLLRAENHVMELQQNAAKSMDKEEEWRQSILAKQQEQESLLIQAQDEKMELEEMCQTQKDAYAALERQLEKERLNSSQQIEQMRHLLREAEARLDSVEAEQRDALSRKEAASKQAQQRQERSVQIVEDKLASAMAQLDERDDEIHNLKAVIDNMRAAISKNAEGVEEAEEEMDELHSENEVLLHKIQIMETERSEMQMRIADLSADHEKVGGLQMELHMLREARDRDRAQKQSAVESAESSKSKTAAERDAALAKVKDLEQQLTAVMADLSLAKSDTERIMTANSNLQNALEAFQGEREAEVGILEEQRVASEEASAAAHAAAIQATNEVHEAEMKAVQNAADAAVTNVMEEVKSLEAKIEESRKENIQLRRSLDEAIHRLQSNQEDVIDRTLMKNILLDWFSKDGKGKKEVLKVMASVLHFSEEEKEKIHIGETHGGTLGKVVGAVAAPLPPPTADVEHLEGDNVREKWVNFLLAEAGGEAGNRDKGGIQTKDNGSKGSMQ